MCVSCRKELAEAHKTNKPCGKCYFYLLISKTFVEAGKNNSRRKWSNQKKDELMFANAEEEFFYEVRLSCSIPSQGMKKTIFYLSTSCRQFWGNTYGCFKMALLCKPACAHTKLHADEAAGTGREDQRRVGRHGYHWAACSPQLGHSYLCSP